MRIINLGVVNFEVCFPLTTADSEPDASSPFIETSGAYSLSTAEHPLLDDMAGSLELSAARELIDSSAAVIFDNDGTLVDSMGSHLRAWQRATAAHGLLFTEEQFYSHAGSPATEIIRILNEEQNKNVSAADILTAKAIALSTEIHHISPVSVVMELMQYAKSKGIPIAVASGGQRKDVLASLKSCGIDALSYFQATVTAEDVKCGKPDPETFLLAASRLGVDPHRCVGFEDAANGLEALQRAGMKSVDVRKLPGYPLPPFFQTSKNK